MLLNCVKRFSKRGWYLYTKSAFFPTILGSVESRGKIPSTFFSFNIFQFRIWSEMGGLVKTIFPSFFRCTAQGGVVTPPRVESLDDPRGHPANQAGLEVDDLFRPPIGKDGGPAFDNLFACGSIIAHQDWMRMKCGSDLAIGTASAAVDVFSSFNP